VTGIQKNYRFELNLIFAVLKNTNMSLLNQKNNKDKKKGDKKTEAGNKSSKFIQKPKSGFVSKQQNTGSQRGS